MTLRYLKILIITLGLCLSMSSCIYDSEPEPVKGDGTVKLRLNFTVSDPKSADASPEQTLPEMTRADEWSYEAPATEWEGVKSLRIIIVRPEASGIVEYNQHIDIASANRLDKRHGYYEYKVAGGERKLIYIFANEESMPAETEALLTGIRPGTAMPDLSGITIGDGTILIDNTGDEACKRYLPMSEVFTENIIDSTKGEEDAVQEAEYFITRGAVKFSFEIDPESLKWDVDKPESETTGDGEETGSDGEEGDEEENVYTPKAGNWRVSKITVTGLADKEYLLPNETIYSPAKYTATTEPLGGRAITDYITPADATTASYTFLPEKFGLNQNPTGEYESAYAPQLYFNESPIPADGKGYMLGIELTRDSTGDLITFDPVTLPNLPALPRNTHVKIVIKFIGHELKCEAILLPYTGVWLNPDFGL